MNNKTKFFLKKSILSIGLNVLPKQGQCIHFCIKSLILGLLFNMCSINIYQMEKKKERSLASKAETEQLTTLHTSPQVGKDEGLNVCLVTA
jgi:hypothetical protein